MKKLVALLLALVMVLSMAACGAKEEAAEEETKEDAAEEVAAEEETKEEETEEAAEEETAEAAEGEEKDQDITIVVSTDLASLDPGASSSMWSMYITRTMYDRLYETDGENSPVPHLAKTTEMVSDTEWIITLQEGAKFSDGSPITANDVAASLLRAKGSGQAAALWAPIVSIEAVDDLTVKFTTESLYPQLVLALTHGSACILPAAYLEEADASGDWSNPVSSGRYIVKERVPGESITLVPNEHFWDTADAAKNTSLTFKVVPEASTRTIMVQTGEADLNVDFDTADYEIATADENVKVYDKNSNTMTFMTMDCENEFLQDKAVRQAINYAIDRESVLLVQGNGFGTVNYTYVANPCYGWLDNPGGYSYDPEKAKEMLTEAGYTEGQIVIDLNVTSAYNAAASLIQSNLKDVGITANIVMMESLDDIVSRAVDGVLDACVTIWGCYMDPALVVERNLGESALGAYNVSRYVNEELEELWQYGKAYQDAEERIPYYEQWQEILCEDAPWVPLYVGKTFCVANADLQGVNLNPQHAYGFHTLCY